MNTQLFIPKKCKVGFNIREDTYTKKLGYVIAFDGKKWRKEVSWEAWRKKEGDSKQRSYNYEKKEYIGSEEKYGDEVKPIEFDNIPTNGFVLNKKVGGYKSDWNMRQTYCRVFDPRGFEFEINVPNLLYILENTNSIKGKGLEGNFVYSWDGKDLVLLPCDSFAYEKAMGYTNLQSVKVSAKTLIPGCSYQTKKEKNIIYIGRYMWYEMNWYGRKGKNRAGKKYHIFYDGNEDLNKGYFSTHGDVSFLAGLNSETPVTNFAEILDKLKEKGQIYNIKEFELIPVEFSTETITQTNNGYVQPHLKNGKYFQVINDLIIETQINADYDYGYGYNENKIEPRFKGYTKSESYFFDMKTKKYGQKEGERYHYSYYSKNYTPEHQIKALKFYDINVIYENGNKVKLKSLYKL